MRSIKKKKKRHTGINKSTSEKENKGVEVEMERPLGMIERGNLRVGGKAVICVQENTDYMYRVWS